eukprot:2255337-Alexandrium_andersonii.AAC.1
MPPRVLERLARRLRRRWSPRSLPWSAHWPSLPCRADGLRLARARRRRRLVSMARRRSRAL